MSARPAINADLLSQMHRISCRVLVPQSGIVGLANDTLSSTLEIEDAYFSRLQQPAKIIGHFDVAHILKSNLSIVILARREDLGPAGVARAGFARAANLPVMVTTHSFEIRGVLELTGKFDPPDLLVGGLARFIIIYQATAIATQYPDTPFSGPAMLVNRSMIEVIAPIPTRGKA